MSKLGSNQFLMPKCKQAEPAFLMRQQRQIITLRKILPVLPGAITGTNKDNSLISLGTKLMEPIDSHRQLPYFYTDLN